MIWKRIKQASPPSDQTWKQIDQTPIPLSSGRIWLADKDGNVTLALGWTWRIPGGARGKDRVQAEPRGLAVTA